MKIAEVIGQVTLSRSHPSLQGATWLVVVPLSQDGLKNSGEGRNEPIVAYDEQSAGVGSMVALSDGAEAAAPFHPRLKPVDAYVAAILDDLKL